MATFMLNRRGTISLGALILRRWVCCWKIPGQTPLLEAGRLMLATFCRAASDGVKVRFCSLSAAVLC